MSLLLCIAAAVVGWWLLCCSSLLSAASCSLSLSSCGQMNSTTMVMWVIHLGLSLCLCTLWSLCSQAVVCGGVIYCIYSKEDVSFFPSLLLYALIVVQFFTTLRLFIFFLNWLKKKKSYILKIIKVTCSVYIYQPQQSSALNRLDS